MTAQPAAAIHTVDHALPHGITLHCRTAGTPGAPLLVFMHGFPEGPFVWDALLAHFAPHYRCVAPALRGYAPSSQPTGTEPYRARHLVGDIAALIAAESADGAGQCAALVAHDWGGAVAWNLANQRPALLQRLVIVNSPHPGTFLRELQASPEQQAASAYMQFLARPDAAARLAEDEFARVWAFFNDAEGRAPAWLTPALRDTYRAQWSGGLEGPCAYYAASPLRPPRGDDAAAQAVALPRETLTVAVPTLVLWGMADRALRPGLLEGLDDFVPGVQVEQIADASHWLVHEQPDGVARHIERFLAGGHQRG